MKKTTKSKLLPQIKKDITRLLISEEAKVTTKDIVTGATVLVALGMMAEMVSALHTSHVNNMLNVHTNQAGMGIHTNLPLASAHTNANAHSNAAGANAHANINNHASADAVNAHANLNSHTSAAALNTHASAANTDVPAIHTSAGVTKGDFHNNLSQGKHSAWTAHSNSSTSNHASTAAATTHNNTAAINTHNNVAAHASSPAVNTHANVAAHSSAAGINRHSNLNTHAARGATNLHTNMLAINVHSNGAYAHTSHASHGQW